MSARDDMQNGMVRAAIATAHEAIACRLEGRRRCGHCKALHRYTVFVLPDPSESPILHDAWEDAAYDLRSRMPEGEYVTVRFPGSEMNDLLKAVEREETWEALKRDHAHLDTREQAVRWLLTTGGKP